MSKFNLVVVGGGAMGSLFGGLIAEKGANVSLLDPWQEHMDAIARNGLTMVGYGGDRVIKLNATANPNELKEADLVFFQCKAIHNKAAAQSVSHLFTKQSKALAISFQNGMGSEEEIAQYLGEDRVLGGLTAQGASIEAPGIVRNYTELPTYIGEMGGGLSERAQYWAHQLSEHGLPTQPSDNIRYAMWKKLFANIGISSVSAIPNLTVGEIFANPTTRAISYAAVDEAITVAQAEGFKFTTDEAYEILESIANPETGTPKNKSSLCIDMLNHRPSEIDYINGTVVKKGLKHSIETKVNSTLVALVKAIESHYVPDTK